MKKLLLLAGVGVGYVLGSKAGRERYEQIRSGAKSMAANPKVQAATSKAQETVAAQAPVVADALKDKLGRGSDVTPPAAPSQPTAPPLS